MLRQTLIAGFAILAAAAPAAAQNLTLRDLSVAPVAQPPAPAAPAGLVAWFDRANATYALGETLTLSVRADADGYVSAFSIGPSGDTTQIYPNAFHPDNFVRAGQTLEIPGPGARAVVTGPVGLERIEVVLSRGQEPVCGHAQFSGGQFRSVIGGVAALQRDLAVVAANAPGGVLATLETSFQSVPASAAFYGQPTVVVDADNNEWPAGETVIVIPQRGYPLPRR